MLLLFSAFLVLNGTFRFLSLNPHKDESELTETDDVFTPMVLLIASAGEIFFGITGSVSALAVIAFDFHSPSLTLFSIGCQAVIGLYTYAVYSVARPIYNYEEDRLQDGNVILMNDNLLDSEERQDAAFVFGHLFCVMMFEGALQGFQLIAAVLLWQGQSNRQKSDRVDKGLAVVFTAMTLLAGFSLIIFGALLADDEPEDEIKGLVIYPPNVVKFASLVIVSGFLLSVFALVCLAATGGVGRVAVQPTAMFVWVWFIAAHVLTQMSFAIKDVDDNRKITGMGMRFTLLSTALIFSTAYLTARGTKNQVQA